MFKKRQRAHLVIPSPWPIFAGICAFAAFVVGSSSAWQYEFTRHFMTTVLTLLVFNLGMWWRDVIREARFEEVHTEVVHRGFRLAFALFVLSEWMLFNSFFWCLFHMSFVPSYTTGGVWPPTAISVLPPVGLPLLNTALLLMSGVTITYAHKRVSIGNLYQTFNGTAATIVLGLCFLYFQANEYFTCPFNMTDSSYGSTFFLMTGFHGLHVLVGLLFLSVCTWRITFSQITSQHHIGFEAAIWYWHFVDMIWLFVYILFYLW
jgi:heme/copper-type cytochrome/quinol oxidase subunit 3